MATEQGGVSRNRTGDSLVPRAPYHLPDAPHFLIHRVERAAVWQLL